MSSDGKTLSRRGRTDVASEGVNALRTWAEGKKLARPPVDQFQWRYVECDQCHMVPLIGQRYSCNICDNYDLCSQCQEKGHEHPLVLQAQPNEDDDD